MSLPASIANGGIVTSVEDLIALHTYLETKTALGFDTEADSSRGNGLDFDRYCVGYSISDTPDRGWYVPLNHARGPHANLPNGVARELLNKMYNRSDLTLYVHHSKFDVRTLRNLGVDVDQRRCKVICTYMGAVLENSSRETQGLKHLVELFFNYKMTKFEAFEVYGRTSFAPTDVLGPYAIDDARWLMPLAEELRRRLLKMGQRQIRLWEELESETAIDLEQCEDTGMLVDRPYLVGLSKAINAEMSELEIELAKILRVPRESMKLGSTMWLSQTMFEKTKHWGILPEWKRGKTKKNGTLGQYSTNKDVVETIAARQVPGSTEVGIAFAEKLLRYKKLSTLRTTFTVALIEHASKPGARWRIHCSFNQDGTATGRFSSSGPNLQNIPRVDEKLPNIRKAFIARPGFVILDADYSQIELRLMAHFSMDPTMVDVYTNDGDIHQSTANACECTRQAAKSINFGLLYGMGDKKLAKTLKCPVKVASAFIKRYFEKYHGVVAFQEATILEAKRLGYVETLLGRRRYLPDIFSTDWALKSMAERQAVNTKIQGSASDLIKVAIRNINRELLKRGWYGKRAFFISQVHDELLYEVEEAIAEEVKEIVRVGMETAVKLRIPLRADPHTAPNWSDAKG